MGRVTAYEATDGTLFRDKKAYLRHEANLLVAKELRTTIATSVKPYQFICGILITEDNQQQFVEGLNRFINESIGLNPLRDMFSIQFKPSASDEGDDSLQQSEAQPQDTTQPESLDDGI